MANLAIRRSPWRAPISSLIERDVFGPNFRRVFDLMNQPPFAPAPGAEMVGIMPAVELSESNGDFICTVELPGLTEKDVQVAYSADELTIKGEKKDERETTDKRYHMLERSYGSFERTFTFPAKVDAEKIVAEFKNGVLTVRLPKATVDKPQGRAIPVVTK